MVRTDPRLRGVGEWQQGESRSQPHEITSLVQTKGTGCAPPRLRRSTGVPKATQRSAKTGQHVRHSVMNGQETRVKRGDPLRSVRGPACILCTSLGSRERPEAPVSSSFGTLCVLRLNRASLLL
jgi:hypothetical protein